MSTGPKIDNRGGARPGAGRKPKTLSASQVAATLKRVRKWARETGKHIDDLLLEIAYAKEEKTVDRISAIKVIKDLTSPKIAADSESDKILGPTVFLPEQRPQLGVVNGGKSA